MDKLERVERLAEIKDLISQIDRQANLQTVRVLVLLVKFLEEEHKEKLIDFGKRQIAVE